MFARGFDIPAAAETFRYYGGWVTKIYGETNPSDPSFFNYTLREPVGVCGQIIPWNFPLLMAAWKLGPALACGNTVILKPAEQTPLTALRLGELIIEAGLPEGVVNIITGFGPGAGSSIAEHPEIDKVAFTGSTEVGKLILQGFGRQPQEGIAGTGRQGARISSSPMPTCEQAVPTSMMGVYFNSGQVCCAGTRIFVQRDRYDEVVDKLATFSKNVSVGDPLIRRGRRWARWSRRSSSIGSRAISTWARKKAPRSRVGGERWRRQGLFRASRLCLADVNNDMRIAREEIFGPVGAAIHLRMKTTRSCKATTPSTGFQRRSGPATSAGRIRWRGR